MESGKLGEVLMRLFEKERRKSLGGGKNYGHNISSELFFYMYGNTQLYEY
jgi:hypothetical protein